MEESSMEKREVGQTEEKVSRALRRKAELLSVVFGLPKPDISFTSVENMPDSFELSGEMVRVFREIITKEDSDKMEYVVAGDTKKGKLFFGKIKGGGESYSLPPLKDLLLSLFGRRRISIHSHGSPGALGLLFGLEDIAYFLLTSDVEVDVVISRWSEQEQTYKVLMTLKGEENLMIEKSHFRRYGAAESPLKQAPYLTEKLRESRLVTNQKGIATLLLHNGCALYVGTGHVDSPSVKVSKIHPDYSIQFEEDPRTKLMLPKI